VVRSCAGVDESLALLQISWWYVVKVYVVMCWDGKKWNHAVWSN
jgi:hypothetical protein